MRTLTRRPKILAAVVLLAAAAGGCGGTSLSDVASVNLVPKVTSIARPDWMTYSGSKEEFTLRPVTAADLVTEAGQCAATAAEAQTPSEDGMQQQQPQLASGGIALQMTECDVVRRAGAPEQLQIGADERGERSVVITYVRGPRPGIYRFTAGRLASIERAPDAPGAKAAPKAKPSKRAARS
jgi:hypothetical protein